MAARPSGFGMTAELERTKDSKYSEYLELQAIAWIMEVINENPSEGQTFQAFLKDGTILLKLINKIEPTSLFKITDGQMAFECMERIWNFLGAIERYGVPKEDLFQVVDLFDNENMPLVVTALHQLARLYSARGGPGVKPL